MLETPKPPSAMGTITWRISSTSPAHNIDPLNLPPPCSIRKHTAEFVECDVKIHLLLAAEEVRDAGLLQMRKPGVARLAGHKQDNVVTFNFSRAETKDALCIDADCKGSCFAIRDMIFPADSWRSGR